MSRKFISEANMQLHTIEGCQSVSGSYTACFANFSPCHIHHSSTFDRPTARVCVLDTCPLGRRGAAALQAPSHYCWFPPGRLRAPGDCVRTATLATSTRGPRWSIHRWPGTLVARSVHRRLGIPVTGVGGQLQRPTAELSTTVNTTSCQQQSLSTLKAVNNRSCQQRELLTIGASTTEAVNNRSLDNRNCQRQSPNTTRLVAVGFYMIDALVWRLNRTGE